MKSSVLATELLIAGTLAAGCSGPGSTNDSVPQGFHFATGAGVSNYSANCLKPEPGNIATGTLPKTDNGGDDAASYNFGATKGGVDAYGNPAYVGGYVVHVEGDGTLDLTRSTDNKTERVPATAHKHMGVLALGAYNLTLSMERGAAGSVVTITCVSRA